MRLIKIKFKDGTEKEWKHEGRAGGSWTKTLSLKDGWAVVTDEYGGTQSFPESTIAEVQTRE